MINLLSNSYMFWWSDTFLPIIVQLRAGVRQVSWSLAPSKWRVSFCWEHITALRVGANELRLPREEVSGVLLTLFRFHLSLRTLLFGSCGLRVCTVWECPLITKSAIVSTVNIRMVIFAYVEVDTLLEGSMMRFLVVCSDSMNWTKSSLDIPFPPWLEGLHQLLSHQLCNCYHYK